MVNLVKLSRSKFGHCWYYLPNTRRQRFFSCRTTNKQEAKRFVQDRLQQIYAQAPPPYLQHLSTILLPFPPLSIQK